jgi:hypothetical protein
MDFSVKFVGSEARNNEMIIVVKHVKGSESKAFPDLKNH